jgi:hypothetical protein
MKKLMNYFHLVLNMGRMTISELVSFAFGIKLNGDPDAISPPYSQTQVQTLASAVQTDLGSRITDPHPTLTAQEQQHVDSLSRAMIADKNYVEQVANDKAKGDRAVFDEIAKRIGFITQKVRQKHQRVFESLSAEKGSFHVRVPSEGKRGVTYIYEYGITPTQGVLPAAWQKYIPLSVTELIITGLPSGTNIGIHYAVMMNPSHTKKTVPKTIPDEKVATAPPVTKTGKVSIVHGSTFLHFSDVIYILIP